MHTILNYEYLHINIHFHIFIKNDIFDGIGCLIRQRRSTLDQTEVSWLRRRRTPYSVWIFLLRDCIATQLLSGEINRSETQFQMLRKDLPEPRRKAPDEVVNSTMRDDDGVTEAARLCTRDSTNRASHTHSSLHSHSTSSWEVRGRRRWSHFCQQQPVGNIVAKKCVSALLKTFSLQSP